MIIIRNHIIPPKGYAAINLFGVVFARHELSATTVNHEAIHTAQQRELLFVPFYLWYLVEYLIRIVVYMNHYAAYCNISFEQEAYAKQSDPSYLKNRRHFNFLNYI